MAARVYKVNVQQLYLYTGIPDKTLYRWLDAETIEDSDDLKVVIQSIISYYKKQLATKSEKAKDALYEEKVRLTKAQSEKLEIENQVTSGELLELADIEKTWTNYVMNCKARLLTIPSKLALELSQVADPNEVQQLIQQEIYQALDELCQDESFIEGAGG